MSKDDIYKLLALPMLLGNINNTYSEYFMFSNEKLMGYSVSLIMEIDELLDNGFTKEEINTLIMECNFINNYPELTKEEGEYLRKYSLRMLDIRYRLYLEEREKIKRLKKEKNDLS